MEFAGTLSASPRVYLDVLNDLLDNLITHGFRRLVLLNGHGGNIVPAQQVVFETRQRYRARTDLILLATTYWSLGGKPHEVDRSIEQTRMGHACEWETSMMLRIAPHLVGDLAPIDAVPAGLPFEPATQGWITKDQSAPGHIGNPRLATRREGRSDSPGLLRRRRRVPESRCRRRRPGSGRMSAAAAPMLEREERYPLWTWSVCVLMLLSTMINYMDRQSLAQMAERICGELRLDDEHYGLLETGFSLAFASGSIITGMLADRISVRWLFPGLVVAWSAVGFATSWATDFKGLLVCRILLGLFESGQWPCAYVTTQRLLSRRNRTLGNSILQSGVSLGAIFTPLVVLAFLDDRVGSWRTPFRVIGVAGTSGPSPGSCSCAPATWHSSNPRPSL